MYSTATTQSVLILHSGPFDNYLILLLLLDRPRLLGEPKLLDRPKLFDGPKLFDRPKLFVQPRNHPNTERKMYSYTNVRILEPICTDNGVI